MRSLCSAFPHCMLRQTIEVFGGMVRAELQNTMKKARSCIKRLCTVSVILVSLSSMGLGVQSVYAVDPPYQKPMERLAEILGSLYVLAPLCGDLTVDWRAEMAELIALDAPNDDRKARISGAFNAGYEAYARFHTECTPAAQTAYARLLLEGERSSRDIYARFAE